MNPVNRIALCMIMALAGFTPPAVAAAGELNLAIRHEIVSLGSDGINRKSEFGERLYRRNDQVWVERIIPAGAHSDSDHANHAEDHKHLDLAASARWITREAKGGLRVRLVNRYERMIVDITPPDYNNVGFDGDWDTAYHLISPKHLASMKPTGQTAPAGSKWYESRNQSGWVKVLWDEKEQYPRQVESGNDARTSHKSMMATVTPAPSHLPWTALKAYQQKEYSDTLD